MKIVLVADTDLKRTRGLMFHEPLGEDECAVFFFPREGKHSFWNNNVDFNISLIFCDKDGKILDIKGLKSQQKNPVYPDTYKTKYVIETHESAPEKNDINIGDMIKIDLQKNEVFKC